MNAATTSPTSPDLLLARLAAGGRADAWEELLALYGERIYNLAFHFAGSAADAEDLTQEIFLRLYQNLRLYRGDVPLAAWALRLSRNLCIDHYRRTRRERRAGAVSEEVLATPPRRGRRPAGRGAAGASSSAPSTASSRRCPRSSPRWCCCATSRAGAWRRPRPGWRCRWGR